jgi:UDP-N-acetylmuramoyl-tripeptide--D-alanyl-D-alanine ligase
VVLVGPDQTRPVRAGLESAGFAESALHVVADAGEAQELLARTTRRGDVVLFENDLPDLYAARAAAGAANGRGS